MHVNPLYIYRLLGVVRSLSPRCNSLSESRLQFDYSDSDLCKALRRMKGYECRRDGLSRAIV